MSKIINERTEMTRGMIESTEIMAESTSYKNIDWNYWNNALKKWIKWHNDMNDELDWEE